MTQRRIHRTRERARGISLREAVLWAGLLALLAIITQTWLANVRDTQDQRMLATSMQDVATALARYGRIEGKDLKVGAAEALEVPLDKLVKAGLLSERAIKLPRRVRLQTKMRLDEAEGNGETGQSELAMRHSKGMVFAWREGKPDTLWNEKVARLIGASGGVVREEAFIGTGAQWQEDRGQWFPPGDLPGDEHLAVVALADAGTGTEVRLHVDVMYGSEGQHYLAVPGTPWRPVWETDSLELRVRARGARRYYVTVSTVDPDACKPVDIRQDASRSSQTTSITVPFQQCWLDQRIVARIQARGTGLDVSNFETDPIDVAAGSPHPERYRMTASVGVQGIAGSSGINVTLVAYLKSLEFKAYDGNDHGRFLRDDVYIHFDVRSPDDPSAPWKQFRYRVTDTRPNQSPNYDYAKASSLGLAAKLRNLWILQGARVGAQAKLGESTFAPSNSVYWMLQDTEIKLTAGD